MTLITGATGFVGPNLKFELEQNGYEVKGTDLQGETDYILDITAEAAVSELIAELKPESIIHLAGFSSVAKSFKDPELCMQINVDGTENLLTAVKKYVPACRLLIVSSSDVYGIPEEIPVNESAKLNPRSPYAESRIKQEELVNKSGLNYVISRSFNHIGPGQIRGFVAADFAAQIATINNEVAEKAEIKVGNLEAIRDFSDVRDVVRAYRLLLEKGKQGETYNVCSGEPLQISKMLDILLSFSEKKIKIEVADEKLRTTDVTKVVGDNSKLKQDTGWKPEYKIEKTLRDVYDYWLHETKLHI